jgi:carboxylate-amine ligase
LTNINISFSLDGCLFWSTFMITIGSEEELQTICAKSGALVEHVHLPRRGECIKAGTLTTEIHRCVIELQTRVCGHPDEVVASLAALRQVAMRRTAPQFQRICASGVHPFSSWEDQPLFENQVAHPHYAHLLDEYGDVARGALSFGMHVHLGFPDEEHRLPIMNALRHILPEILALSVSSPFFAGRDTGLQSWRHSLLGRYPRMGVPDIWDSENAYFSHLERLKATGCLPPGMGLWEDLRLHHRYGTLEVRIADAISCLERIWLIVALLHCEAITLALKARSGNLPEFWPRPLIEENKWRVRRHGLDARLINWSDNSVQPMSSRLLEWGERLAPAAASLGIEVALKEAIASILRRGTCADEQRKLRLQSKSWTDFALAMSSQTEDSAAASLARFGKAYDLA